MKKLEIARTVLTTATNIGVSSIVAGVTKTFMPKTNVISQVCGYVGGFAMSLLVGDAVSDYAGKKFDETVDAICKLKEE